ncbi:hypothetical protein CBR_g41554 [Chara braunii]|uniref:Uncharacterized protein n=1 Tax=Chara braunii TaxID=69332 RepID=A0A388K322_CHABU|nr:hypothetical protein CBR_g41554 [Chara braunii]|eukprot:GBG64353.1 hypothetical protein CBR_g41554 [Chara braunii]
MMETCQGVEELIKQGQLVLHRYVAESFEKLERERNGRKESKKERVERRKPQLSVDMMEENIRQFENTLEQVRRKVEEYRRLKEQQEEEERVMEELRQKFHYEEAGSEVASILQSINVHLMHLEKKLDDNTAAIESMPDTVLCSVSLDDSLDEFGNELIALRSSWAKKAKSKGLWEEQAKEKARSQPVCNFAEGKSLNEVFAAVTSCFCVSA